MGKTVNATVSTTSPLKRENYERIKHDSAFSNWKILIGPCDWENYLSNKEGAERYRTRNLPNCSSSCPGLYELGIVVSLSPREGKSSNKFSSKNVIPVYLGQADNVRTRLQQYGRDGDHLENGWSNGGQNDQKVLGLFSDIFSYGFVIAFRWAPMESKKDAEKTETQLLKTFDYAWNRGMNGDRRPNDIQQKLKTANSHTKRVPQVFKKLHIIPPKKVGLNIKHYDPPVLENGSSFYTNQKDTIIFTRIFKFTPSRPTLVSKKCNINNNDEDVDTCGVALGHGSICIRPPVEGRKRCVDHKGTKVNAFVRPNVRVNTEDNTSNNLTCGVTLDDDTFCTKVPVAGRKRCEEHKGMRINKQDKHYVPKSGDLALQNEAFCIRKKSCESGVDSLTCVAETRNGSFCRRKPGKDSKFCWQHEGRAKINFSSYDLDSAIGTFCNREKSRDSGVYSLTCVAVTRNGSFCKRKPGKHSMFCWQHEG